MTRFAAATVILLLTSQPALAHAPVVEHSDTSLDEPIRVTWPLDTSVAIYGYLSGPHDVDVVAFDVREKEATSGVPLYLRTLVPACGAYRQLLPGVALVGPGQPALPGETKSAGLPFKVDETQGIALLTNTRQGVAWYEPYSGKNYFWQESMSLSLGKPGSYTIYIWSPGHHVGDYVLTMGTRERWGPREIGRAIRHMPRLLRDREIHNEACREDLKLQAPSTNPLPAENHSVH
ncbi:MAG: hypothetical protein AMJ68_05520 [Acidithiobacillales bacterium SG8_45]|jgi:hypothetical protein|nr:MAG: hypothetical protein AMJ68_05520 [Acidithiobacillales bacterium SG8_45]